MEGLRDGGVAEPKWLDQENVLDHTVTSGARPPLHVIVLNDNNSRDVSNSIPGLVVQKYKRTRQKKIFFCDG